MTLCEYDVVRLTRALPGEALAAGMIGTILMIHDNGRAYEVEFCDDAGITLAVLAIEANDLELVISAKQEHVKN